MNDNRVVDLNDQVVLVEETGRLFHQQHGGKGHEIQRALEHLGAVVGEKAIDGIGGGKFRA